MKLNQECIRDFLLYLENEAKPNKYIFLETGNLGSLSNKYSLDEILYTGDKLLEAGYINGKIQSASGYRYYSFPVSSITWDGHKFLDTIRDDAVWTKTKSLLSGFQSVSVQILSEVASKVILKMITGEL